MLNITQVFNGAKKYIYSELLPHLSTTKQLLFAGYIELAEGNLQNAALKLKEHPAVSMLGLFDESGNVDDTRLYNVMKNLFVEKKTIDIPLIGTYTFSQNDVQRLFDLMRGA
jgi:hypothetical protein